MRLTFNKKGGWKDIDIPLRLAEEIYIDGQRFRYTLTTKVDDKLMIDMEPMMEILCKKENKKIWDYEAKPCWRLTMGSTIKECQGCEFYSGN